MLTHNVYQWIDEFMTYKEFSSHMKQLNDEQKTIVDDILYQKFKNPIKPFHVFLIGDVGTGKMFTLVCEHFTCLYKTCYDIILNKLQMLIF